MQFFGTKKPWRLYAAAAAFSVLTSVAVGTLIPRHLPRVHDEFSYLLAGQTFAGFRLTNPTPAHWEFFESHHTLMVPTMMSKYPPGQGLVLAVGYWLGHPIFGVWLASAGFVIAFVWMLRGFFSARWALLGGVLVGTQFGFTHYWAQSFWGGALAATGGALVFGGACRIWRQPLFNDALALGLGVALLMHTRPLEGLLACLVPAGLVLVRWLVRDGLTHRRTLVKFVLPCGAVIALSFLFLIYYNFRVTGSAWNLPYLDYEQRYNGEPPFVWQTGPAVEPTFVNPAMADVFYDFEKGLRLKSPLSVEVLSVRLRILGYGYLGAVLGMLAVIGAIWRPDWRTCLAIASLALCALPLALSYLFMPHYQAPAAALTGLLFISGLRRCYLSSPRRLRNFGVAVSVLLAAQAYTLSADPTNQHQLAQRKFPTVRQKIEDQLVAGGGRHLIFVRLVKPYYLHDTWVFNYAPIDAQPVVWAWDRGPDENRLLVDYYGNRAAVLMTVNDGKIEFTTNATGPAGARPAPAP